MKIALPMVCAIGVMLASISSVAETVQRPRVTWSEQFHGLAFSVQPNGYAFKLGEDINASTWLTNFGSKPVDFSITSSDGDHRYALFYADGRPVPKSKSAREDDDRRSTGTVVFFRNMMINLKPGETQHGDTLERLQRWFDITESGTYTLIVMRGVPLHWNGSLIVSNPLILRITGGKAPVSPKAITTWGNPDDKLSLSLGVAGQRGRAISCRVRVKNVGRSTKTVFAPTFPRCFHLALFDASGAAVPKTTRLLTAEDETLPRNEIISIQKLSPGKELAYGFNLREYFKITRGGTYRLVVLRRQEAWHRGFAISNMVKFTIR